MVKDYLWLFVKDDCRLVIGNNSDENNNKKWAAAPTQQ